MRTWRGCALVLLLVIAACDTASAQPATPTLPTGALTAWQDFPATRTPRPIVFLEELPRAPGFTSDSGKIAEMCRKFGPLATALPTEIPARAQVTWPDGSTASYPALSAADAYAAATSPPKAPPMPECSTVAPLTVTGVRLGTAGFRTDRDVAQMPAWLFMASGALGELAYPAIAPSAFWGGSSSTATHGDRATVSQDGRILTYGFIGAAPSGPCGASYGGTIAESDAAVAVAVRMDTRQKANPAAACPAVGYRRTITLRLTRPLGGRVVVDASGFLVEVTLA